MYNFFKNLGTKMSYERNEEQFKPIDSVILHFEDSLVDHDSQIVTASSLSPQHIFDRASSIVGNAVGSKCQTAVGFERAMIETENI